MSCMIRSLLHHCLKSLVCVGVATAIPYNNTPGHDAVSGIGLEMGEDIMVQLYSLRNS